MAYLGALFIIDHPLCHLSWDVANLCSQMRWGNQSPKGPENVKITTLLQFSFFQSKFEKNDCHLGRELHLMFTAYDGT